MTDIAALGISITTKGISEASSGLNKLTSEGGKAESATNKLSSSFDGLNKYMQAAQGAFAALGIGAFVKQALDAALAMERINSTMKATAGTAAATARELAFVREESQRLGLEFRSTAEAYAKFSAASKGTSIEGEGVRKIFKGVSEAATAMRLTTEQSNGVFLALQQMMSKGTVQAEELRGQLAERLPGAFGMAAKAMGMTTQELGKQLELGKVLSSDLLPKLAEEMHKTYGTAAIEAAAGGQAAINRFKNSVFESASVIGTALMPAFTGILNILTPLMDYLKMFIGGIEILAVKLATLPDKAAAAWRVIKSGEGLFSTAGMAMYAKEKAASDAAAEAAIADIMKKYMPVSAAKTAAEMAEEQSKVAAALAKAAKAATDKVKYSREEDLLLTNILATEESKNRSEKAALEIAKLQLHETELITKELDRQVRLSAELADLNNQIKTDAAQLAADKAQNGMFGNGTSTFGSIDAQLAADKAAIEERASAEQIAIQSRIDWIQAGRDADLEAIDTAHQARMAAIDAENKAKFFDQPQKLAAAAAASASSEKEYQSKISGIKTAAAAQSNAMIGALNKALTLSVDKELQKQLTAEEKASRAKMQLVASYSSFGAEAFTLLAETQEQSSRSGFETAKAFNIAAATMSTAAAIMNAFATQPWPQAPIAAGLAAATGVIQIANIASTSFEGGGSVSAPSGSFAAGGSSAGGSTGLSNLPTQIASIQDSQTAESLAALTASTDNAALVIGRLSKSIDSLNALFKSGGAGYSLATNAPNRMTGIDGEETITQQILTKSGIGAYANAYSTSISSAYKYLKGMYTLDASSVSEGIKGIATVIPNFISDIGTSISSALFGGSWKTTAAGISLGMDSGSVDAQDYITKKKSGGWFSSSKTKTTYTDNAELGSYVQSIIDPYVGDIVRMAATLGTTAATETFTAASINIKTAGRKPEDIAADVEKWATGVLQGMALTVDGLQDVIGSYDDAYEALKTLNDALVSTNEAFALVGKTALQGSLDNAQWAISLQSIFGGMDSFNTAMDNYFTTMYTDAEQDAMKAAAAATKVNNAFAEMGITAPTTNAAFNALRNSLDITTESGSALFASLTLLGPTFAEMTKQSEALAQAFVDSISTISESAAAAIRDIQNSTLSTESPEMRYARAQQEFLYAAPEMAGELGKSLLDASRAMYASGDGYIADYANVMEELSTLAGLDTSVDPNASTIAELKTLKEAIVELQQAIVDKLTVIEAPLVRVAANI